jgi:hypothetical protein
MVFALLLNVLREIQADAMSNTKREPLLSDDELREMRDNTSTISTYPVYAWLDGAMDIRDHYEAARAKDAELIQMLVDEVAEWMEPNLDERFRGPQWQQSKRILDAAAAAGYKPSGQ